MKLIKFTVSNYKVFKENFTIDLSKDSIVILTGRNNTGKSTILEAINCFFQVETKAKTIPSNCFSRKNIPITMTAVFENESHTYTIVKKYKEETAPTFQDDKGNKIDKSHILSDVLEEILSNKPFYITPSMSHDDIDNLIQLIYSGILKNRLDELETENLEGEEKILADEYAALKQAYPMFLKKLKSSTDQLLNDVSKSVTTDLQSLFTDNGLSLHIFGGESGGFTSTEILKTTSSKIEINKLNVSNMPLANQGTGLQRMSLIYLIQKMIERNLLGGSDNQLLLIDEPEAFLHPEAVRALSQSLYSIGREMPLMISTHSPILIDLSEPHTSIQVFKVIEKSAIEIFKSDTDRFDQDDVKNMKILNYVDSYVNEFFFADKIIIVEGDTEYIAFKHLAQEKEENIHIIRARGKSTIRTLMKILNKFKSNYAVLHDVDNRDKHSATTLKAQLTTCKNIYAEKSRLKSNDGIRIFCSISHFEHAIGIGDVQNSQKTRTVFEILHSEGKYASAKKIIENLFETIVNPEKQENCPINFLEIKSEHDYEYLFSPLLQAAEKITN